MRLGPRGLASGWRERAGSAGCAWPCPVRPSPGLCSPGLCCARWCGGAGSAKCGRNAAGPWCASAAVRCCHAKPPPGHACPTPHNPWVRSACAAPRQQLEEVRRRYETARRRRQREEPRLLAALRELQVGWPALRPASKVLAPCMASWAVVLPGCGGGVELEATAACWAMLAAAVDGLMPQNLGIFGVLASASLQVVSVLPQAGRQPLAPGPT